MTGGVISFSVVVLLLRAGRRVWYTLGMDESEYFEGRKPLPAVNFPDWGNPKAKLTPSITGELPGTLAYGRKSLALVPRMFKRLGR